MVVKVHRNGMSRHPSVMGLQLAIAIWVAASSAVAAASAQDEAESLVQRGLDLRRNGDDQAALPLFQKAHALAPTPRSVVQLGLVEQAVGQWADAEEHLADGLRSTRDPWIRKNRAVIEESLRTVKGHIGSVEVTGDPAGAEVLVNGRRRGQLPLSAAVRVNAGSVDVELNASGHIRGFRTVTVVAGQYQTVVIRLEKIAQLPTRPPIVEPPIAIDHGSRLEKPGARPWQHWAALGAFAGGAAATGAGIFGVVKYNDRVGAFNKDCDEGPQGPLNKGSHQPDGTCRDLQSQYHGARTLSIVGFSVAGALAATGAVLLLTAPDSSSHTSAERTVAWTCVPTVLHLGAACEARF